MTISSPRRMSTLFLCFLISGLSSVNATAGVLTLKSGEKSIEGVKLANEAVFQSEGKPLTLKPYASGIRKKKIALFWAKVYVGQIFAPEGLKTPPASIEEAFATLSKQSVVAITLTFLRDVSAGRQRDAFADALETNGNDPKSVALQPLFATVEKAGEAKDTFTTTIVLERRKDGSEWIHYENGQGELQSANYDKGILGKVLGIWVGKPADSGMKSLHRQFLGKDE